MQTPIFSKPHSVALRTWTPHGWSFGAIEHAKLDHRAICDDARVTSEGIDLTQDVVATADDGGSSGRIRRERGGLPPGDLRQCLLALADQADDPFGKLFAHRYMGAGDLAGPDRGGSSRNR